MKIQSLLLSLLFLAFLGTNLQAVNTPKTLNEAELQEWKEKWEEKTRNWSAEEKQKFEKKLARIQKKIEARKQKMAKKKKKRTDFEIDSLTGLGIGLAVILVGALFSVLGIGILGNLFVAIGIIILIVALVLWILDRA